jgi:hypothetical protein
MKFDIVDFNPGGDFIMALYINGKVYMAGDSYHDKIFEQIEGFVNGFEYALDVYQAHIFPNYKFNYWTLTNEVQIQEFEEMGAPFPEEFPFTEYEYEPTK